MRVGHDRTVFEWGVKCIAIGKRDICCEGTGFRDDDAYLKILLGPWEKGKIFHPNVNSPKTQNTTPQVQTLQKRSLTISNFFARTKACLIVWPQLHMSQTKAATKLLCCVLKKTEQHRHAILGTCALVQPN